MSDIQEKMADILAGMQEFKDENEQLKAAMVAPTDSGIDRFDSLCSEFNSGKRDLVSLCCALWNSGTVAGRAEKS